jgi:hypothetical protein
MNRSFILVDIDGPLLAGKSNYLPANRNNSLDNGLEVKLDDFSVWAHNIWVKYSNANIIIATNWIFHKTSNELKHIFKQNGLEFDDRYYEEYLTTHKKRTSERGHEVWWTIADLAKEGDTFLIVDDDQTCDMIKGYVEDAVNGKNPATRWDKMDNPPQVKWIEVDTTEGLSLLNFKEGGNFLGFNEYRSETYTPWDYMNYDEFGKKMRTKEEKEKEKEEMDILLACMI